MTYLQFSSVMEPQEKKNHFSEAETALCMEE